MLPGTPLHSRTAPLCEAQNWRRWAGYLVAGSYDLTHEREYHAIRSAAALIDISPLYKYLIDGPDACRLLNRVVTRDVRKCAVGQVMYTPWCNEQGKVIDDGTISRLGEQTYRLTSADPNMRWLQDNAVGLNNVRLREVSASTAALALQGPFSRRILESVFSIDLSGLRYFRLTRAETGGIPVTISRTGYTGDLGYEIWVEADQAVDLWDLLMQSGKSFGITPAGMLALDIARVEAGLLLIEVDYVSADHAVIEAQKSSPYELGLGWTVDLDKPYFVGQAALREENRRSPAWRFVGLEIDWDSLERLYRAEGLPPQLPTAAWRASVPVHLGGRQVGYASSGCWSPILKKYIALAHLEADYARLGTHLMFEMTVEHRRRQAEATVVKTPFFDPERKRR